MKLVISSAEFGTVTWEMPEDLSKIIDEQEATMEAITRRVGPIPGLPLDNVAGHFKGVVLTIIQGEISKFFGLLTHAHRMAKTANPASKYARILEDGLAKTAKNMKKA